MLSLKNRSSLQTVLPTLNGGVAALTVHRGELPGGSQASSARLFHEEIRYGSLRTSQDFWGTEICLCVCLFVCVFEK